MGSPSRPYRVLTLDGGGMRGLYTASLLAKLNSIYTNVRSLAVAGKGVEGSYRLDIGTAFDMIAGTSTGAILGIAIASGIHILKVVDLYTKAGPEIFPDPMPDESRARRVYWWVCRHRKRCAAKPTKLREHLSTWFKEETLKELYDRRGIGICVPAVKLIDEAARVFKTPHHPDKQMDNACNLVDVCMASAAAPLFFPLASLQESPSEASHVFADGGLWANNPVLVGLLEALLMAKPGQAIHVVSIGTCSQPPGESAEGNDLDRGFLQWKFGVNITKLSMNAQASAFQYMATLLAQSLGKDREIKIYRIPQSPPSSQHMKYLQLDSSSPQALSTFRSLGEKDAAGAHSKTHDKSDAAMILGSAFFDMKSYPSA